MCFPQHKGVGRWGTSMLGGRVAFSTGTWRDGVQRFLGLRRLSTYSSPYGSSYFFFLIFLHSSCVLTVLDIHPSYLPHSRQPRDVCPNRRKEGTCTFVLSGMHLW